MEYKIKDLSKTNWLGSQLILAEKLCRAQNQLFLEWLKMLNFFEIHLDEV